MLRLGKLTDYAMLVMSQMAKTPHTVLSATTLADALHLGVPTVSKVLKMLADSTLVSSVRGAEGGYHLARPGNEITVAEVITAMEGGLAMTECCESVSRCALDPACNMRGNWQKINKRVHAYLSGFTIADMLEPISAQPIKKELSDDQ
ncbi:MAG: SUF system Fe-S cluster assembly regulator [Gammaproteobacteria bacterium RIFCSPHIGHO2_12_FULL_43_28]|nr:MAG: SUF system Fe-S cluster assembly regulator [Gammaproteobacteria bacterium RIFCSPHIGHO2_12_FULL_43_28]